MQLLVGQKKLSSTLLGKEDNGTTDVELRTGTKDQQCR